MTFDAQNYYFSGQGVVMIGSRDANGNPTGLRPLGNVSDLKISVATTVVDHKGSQDGQRAIDSRLQTETKPSISVTIDNWIAKNLAQALRGVSTAITTGSVTAEAVNVYPGLVTGFQYINISSLVLSLGMTALTPYTTATAPYDYKVNLAAGSVEINDGTLPFATLGVVPTAVTVGATTAITLSNTGATPIVIGDSVALTGFTGANASLLNGKVATVTAASGTAISVNINTTGMTITATGSPLVTDLTSTFAVTAAYSYTAQELSDALTQPLLNIWLRFEGLNTVENNDPVIVEVFKFSVDPLKELALISDTYSQFMLEGELLADGTKTTGSKYFRIKSLS
jgi:hypothetical protein